MRSCAGTITPTLAVRFTFARPQRSLFQVELYMTSARDCTAAQGATCTKEEPCTPCDLTAVEVFVSQTHDQYTLSLGLPFLKSTLRRVVVYMSSCYRSSIASAC